VNHQVFRRPMVLEHRLVGPRSLSAVQSKGAWLIAMPALAMSFIWRRPEWLAQAPNDAFDPKQTLLNG
jgi:hypothetical protein